MPIFHLFVLALVQGITELLPISSSGHLILVPKLFNWADQGPEIDVMMHVGSMVAILLYFWKDVIHIFYGFLKVLGLHFKAEQAQLFLNLCVASIPAVIVGFLLNKYAGDMLRDPRIVIFTMIFYAFVLYAVDRYGKQTQGVTDLTYRKSLLFGVFQALALVPGTSRSGICMTAGRLMGFKRPEAARFAFLMAIPTILGAGLLKGIEIYKKGSFDLFMDGVIAGALTFVISYGAIAFMMRWLQKSTFTPFVIYRLVFGVGLIYVFLM